MTSLLSFRLAAFGPIARTPRSMLLGCLVAAAGLSGCAGTGGDSALPGVPVSVKGVASGIVHGGPNPVMGATVQLYATTSNGYGAAPTLLGTTTSNSVGSFTFTSAAACPTGQQAYITANSGSSGNGQNPQSLLMAALGDCSSISPATSIWIDEVTTVAAAYALSGFTSVGGTPSAPVVQIGAPAANNAATPGCTVTNSVTAGCTTAGLAHAFQNALNLASSVNLGATLPNGQAYTVTPSNPFGQVPTAEMNSLANSLVACVNSTGGTAGGSNACGQLFLYTTPPSVGAAAPANTLQAVLNLAQYPTLASSSVKGVYNLATPQTSFFVPALTAAPADWSLGVVYTGVSNAGNPNPVTSAFGLALDAADHVYVSQANGSPAASTQVIALTSNGSSLWASVPNPGFVTPRTAAADTLGHVWVVNNGTSPATGELLGFNTADGSSYRNLPLNLANPFGLAVDLQNNLWFSTFSTTSQGLFELQQANGYSVATFANPPIYTGQGYSVAIDAGQNVWTANSASSGNSSVGLFANTGTAAAPAYTGTALASVVTGTTGQGLALDAADNAWTASSNGLAEVTPQFSGSAIAALNTSYPGVSDTLAKFLTVDAAGNEWIPDQTANLLIRYSPLSSLTASLNPCYVPNGATACASLFAGPKRVLVDSSGSVWVAGSSVGLVQIIGSGTPTNPLFAQFSRPAAGSASAAISLSPGSVTFASTAVGATSAGQVVTLTNTGTATLRLQAIALAGASPTSFMQSGNCGSTLAAGGSCTVNVSFTPRTAGALAATISLTDNAANSPQTVALSGTGTGSSATPPGIQPATQVVVNTSGYFPDPLPIHYAAGTTGPMVFSGSNKTLMTCTTALAADCFTISTIQINTGTFPSQAAAFGTTLNSIGNNNIYQDNQGNWQMATTLHLSNPSQADTTWSVIAHAHPTNSVSPVPTAWLVDTLLIGSLSTSAKANYDGKYIEDGGSLYLLYSQALTPNPLHDGVVAQLMVSSTQVASTAYVPLIAPETVNNGFNSEYFFITQSSNFKLVETGNITIVNGKYVLAYSTGNFQEPNYKLNLAWSDTFLPPTGTLYKKDEMLDTTGVWGQVNHIEGLYLLQAQQSAWPNYVAGQVVAPGVPSIVPDGSGNYFLFFAGFDPTDHPPANGTTDFDPSHRRPYFMKLNIAIPAGATVTGTSNTALSTWITAATQ